MSYRDCSRCTAMRRGPGGGRCTRRTCKYGPMCWQHTTLSQGVRVRESPRRGGPNGMGLYASRDLPRGHRIQYRGKKTTKRAYNRMFPGDYRMEYAVQNGRAEIIDAAKTNSSVARYANDGRRAAHQNAELVPHGGLVYLTTTKPIRRGAEILTPYGDEFWQAQTAPAALRNRHRQWIFS